jgi:hypothetical protein
MARNMTGLGIDIAKLVLHGVGMDDTGHVVRRKRMARSGSCTCTLRIIGLDLSGAARIV